MEAMESVEFGTTPAERLERLRGQLRGRPVGTRAARRTQASRGSALLFGVMLHAASRLEADLELTPLEARLVAPLRLLLSEEEVRDFGRLYREETAARSTAAVLPDSLAARSTAEGYAIEDLLKDLPLLREETLAQANVSVVDLDTAAPSEQDTWDTEEFNAGQAAYGYGATVVTASAAPALPAADEGDPEVSASFLARVDLYAFLCERESNEWSVDDEIYWGLSSSGAFGNRQQRLSRVYTNIDKNEWHNLDANTTLYNGRVDTSLVCNISCWEEDDGGSKWRDELRRKLITISEELLRFTEIMEIYGFLAPQYGDFLDFTTLVAAIAYVIQWLIDLFKNPDDLVQQRTLVFDQAALRWLVTHGGSGSTGWVFDGGSEGRHRLQLRWVGNPPPADAPNHIKVISPASGQWGTTTSLPTPTDVGPAVAAIGDTLYVAIRVMNNGTMLGKKVGGTWHGYYTVPNRVSLAGPALAVHDGKLFLATTGTRGELHVTGYTGSAWEAPVKLSGTSSMSPALVSHSGALCCAVRGSGDNPDIWFARRTGSSWGSFAKVPGIQSFHAPSMAVLQGTLYLAHVGFNGVTYVNTFNGTSWSAAVSLGGTTDSAPALTNRNGVLHCAVRGLDSNIYLSYLSGSTWSGFTQTVPGAATMSEPALAGGTGDTLHIGYRTT
ncbi:hypothetical protein ACFH04_06315 [Streptomyces noboritoensis]|uniref:Uncharacterized protein n=1 Tax=Streptomyces noboritoensis TaxID=67337 RepID=A0ABV6TC61_9ACTN